MGDRSIRSSKKRSLIGSACCESASALGQIKSDLLLFAWRHLDAFEGCYKVVHKSTKVKGLEVRQYQDPEVGGSLVTIAKAEIPGFTIDVYKAFKADIVRYTTILDSTKTMTLMADMNNHIVSHTMIEMPTNVKNRSIFNVYHQYEQDDGSYIDVSSYKGTQKVYSSEEGKALSKDTVIATNHIDYTLIEPYKGGCYWKSVLCVNLGNSLPENLQMQEARKMALHAESIIHFIMTGQGPN